MRIDSHFPKRLATACRSGAFLLCLAYGSSLTGQNAIPKPSGRLQPATPGVSQALRIGPEDTVTISAVDAEELSKAWRVGNSGDLNLPMVGRVHAAGLTVEELETELLTRLKKYIIDPQVVVYVSEFRSQPVTVVGAVEKPGTAQIQGANGLFDVLMLAGGPKNVGNTAGNTVTVTRRAEHGTIAHPNATVKDGSSVAVFTLDDVMQGRGAAASLPVRAGDVITVSDVKEQRMVYVVGEVNKPGAIELITQDRASMLRVLAVAGGLTHTAAPGSAFIRHTGSDLAQAGTTRVNVKRVMSGKSKDVALDPGDILIVPSSKFKGILQTASQSALTTGIYILARF
jgi:polysaccharide biosynthesis/export protein